MSIGQSPHTLSIRRWLSLGLAALFLAPILTLSVIGFVLFRDQQGPWEPHTEVRERLIDNPDRWEDPAWQAALRQEFSEDRIDIVLLTGGKEVFRTRPNPLDSSGDGARVVQTVSLEDADPPRRAYIYSDERSGPPEQLREWFVPVSMLGVLVLMLSGIAWFLRRSIIVPLTATGDAARRIADGELDISLPTSRVREVAELGQAFRAMSSGLQASLQRQAAMERDRRLFISAIAHDLRTPLFSLRGALEGLDRGIANTPEKRSRYIGIAQDKAATLERLISDLFAFTRLEYMEEVPERTPFDLGALLSRLAEGMRPRAEAHRIRLLLEADPTEVTVAGDSDLLTRVIENLLDNALRHTPEGGMVRLSWRKRDMDVIISVTDTGPGIAERDLPHLFDPLYRGESSRSRTTGGAGLGLTIARRIVEAHGGAIVAGNTEAGGAVLTVTLPQTATPS